MLPIANQNQLTEMIDVQPIPSFTYRLNFNTRRIIGSVDGLDSMVQAIRKLFSTERFAWAIYDSQYGVEFESLLGQDMDFVTGVLRSRVEDALKCDERVIKLLNFEIMEVLKEHMVIALSISTIYGLVSFEREVIE
jgi:Protein of unknown function (DUF2634).